MVLSEAVNVSSQVLELSEVTTDRASLSAVGLVTNATLDRSMLNAGLTPTLSLSNFWLDKAPFVHIAIPMAPDVALFGEVLNHHAVAELFSSYLILEVSSLP